MTYPEKLRAARSVKQLSRPGLAKLSGVSVNTIYNHEHGKHFGHGSTQKLLATALGTTTDILNEPSDRLFP